MFDSQLTQKDRAFAAHAGAPGTPFPTPPDTPSRRSSNPESQSSTTMVLPKSAYYIIFVEGCERFCYYGLRTVLLLYFMHFLRLGKDSATAGYHLFSFACYFTPTIGAIISDGFIGRYSTILYLSVVYLIGTIVLSVTAIPSVGGRSLTGPVIGLLLISIGTGGIKPCVSAFGADQISTANVKQLSRFFAFFYFAINCGSLFSTLLTPLLRSKIHCFGYDCYSLAFGIPALLMLVAIVIFVVGTPLYKRVPPKENIIVKFTAIIMRAMRNAMFGSSGQRAHWLYHADDQYTISDIEDVRSVLNVFLLFTPIPIFFALYDQSGSRWTYQASLMDGSLGGLGRIEPDQMQALNSLFILLFIPLFEEVIYPIFARWNLLIKPLQRMFCGMLVMVLAFIVTALVQNAIESKAEAAPIRYNTNIFNGYQCSIGIGQTGTLEMGKTLAFPCAKLLKEDLVITSTCNSERVVYQWTSDKVCPSVLVLSNAADEARESKMTLTALTNPATTSRGVKESASLRVVSLDGKQTTVKTLPNKYTFQLGNKLTPTEYQSVLATSYRIENITSGETTVDSLDLFTTAVYTVLLHRAKDNKFRAVLFEDVPPFTVHILWQVFQYAIVTAAEMLVSVTGLIFAYSQAPRRYKSVIMSAWLMTTAFGDLIVVLVAEVRLVKSQVTEFLLFAALMAFAAFIFGVLAINYRDIQPNNADAEDQQLILDRNAPEPDEAIPLAN